MNHNHYKLVPIENYKPIGETIERLSRGKRINAEKDDNKGLSIQTRVFKDVPEGFRMVKMTGEEIKEKEKERESWKEELQRREEQNLLKNPPLGVQFDELSKMITDLEKDEREDINLEAVHQKIKSMKQKCLDSIVEW